MKLFVILAALALAGCASDPTGRDLTNAIKYGEAQRGR